MYISKRELIFLPLADHIMSFAHGLGIGWVSPTVQIIQSPQTPLSFPVTVEQVSWIGSLFGFGFLSGNIMFGLTVNRLSRKLNMYLLAFPHMVSISIQLRKWWIVICLFSAFLDLKLFCTKRRVSLCRTFLRRCHQWRFVRYSADFP